ncbi:MAG: single-stranded DNA-binding protein [Candidatus Edwardsbacteria bacterium]|nr:single-stranded DNA-binding protein [Candidatus Edwardsbacteria bacterium]MBU1576329.1 single-stranded DNA-binding protein [Candidatus Edwardsbacteria bacterium]MBU2462882.1 single-stranded DNA-binding protein [Candidatus Edwardsbacteria bacterium]MBU2593941.1 single-stranded DNA-binding protein [Candidatus Edwardsbacteria bacterium]
MSELRVPTLNRVLLSGRLTRDPELRYTPNGSAVCNFSLAVNRRHKDQSGRWQDDTTFINVVAWQAIAENVNKYLHKGSPVMVEGRLESRSWETETGQKRTVIEIRADSVRFLEKSETSQDSAPEAD